MAAVFDELRFGRENMLDLRSGLPTGAQATLRADAFLRERQVAGAREVLVITGRGNNSRDGIAVVRPAVEQVLARLRREGIVSAWSPHTPGSWVVVPAPISAMLEAPRRRHQPHAAPTVDDAAFDALEPATRVLLRSLALRALEALGAPADETFVRDEMRRQFSLLATTVRAGLQREARLRQAVQRALDEMEDRA